MTTDLCEGVFNQILLKMAKNDHFETIFLSLPHILTTIGFSKFPPISYLSDLDKKKFGWFWFILSRVMLKKPLESSPPPPPPLRTGRVNDSGDELSHDHSSYSIHQAIPKYYEFGDVRKGNN